MATIPVFDGGCTLVGERRGLVEGRPWRSPHPSMARSSAGSTSSPGRDRRKDKPPKPEEQVRQEMDAPRREGTALDLDVRSTNRRSQ
jgi:hypothetical protein